MTFELFCPVYNEEYLIPYLVEFYKQKTNNNIIFNFYDNGSTDDTINVIKKLKCNLGVYETGGEIRDDLLLEFKNNIWKNSKSDFVIVIDCDEFIEINLDELKGNTIVQCEGWNMVGDGTQNPLQINRGHRLVSEDKYCIFSPKDIKEINYTVGAHFCNPIGNIKKCNSFFKLYHMKAINEEYLVQKYRNSKSRLSELNKKQGWGNHYLAEENDIREGYRRSLTDENYKIIR